jgi:hypothetical protein
MDENKDDIYVGMGAPVDRVADEDEYSESSERSAPQPSIEPFVTAEKKALVYSGPHDFVRAYLDENDSAKYTSTPSIPKQEYIFPHSVKECGATTDVFDLSVEADRERFSEYKAAQRNDLIHCFIERHEPPDRGKVNFRVMVCYAKLRFMKIDPSSVELKHKKHTKK